MTKRPDGVQGWRQDSTAGSKEQKPDPSAGCGDLGEDYREDGHETHMKLTLKQQ